MLRILGDGAYESYVKAFISNQSHLNTSIIASIITDTNAILSKYQFLLPFLSKKGLLPGQDLTQLDFRTSRFLFCPNQKITNEIQSLVNRMNSTNMIGFQIRTGGSVANTNENHPFIQKERLPSIGRLVASFIHPNTAVYVSTDSSLVLDYINNCTNKQIYFMTRFDRGHSSPSRNRQNALRSLEGAICDLGVLSFSKSIYFTSHSSYGRFAAALSSAHSINRISYSCLYFTENSMYKCISKEFINAFHKQPNL